MSCHAPITQPSEGQAGMLFIFYIFTTENWIVFLLHFQNCSLYPIFVYLFHISQSHLSHSLVLAHCFYLMT